MAKLLKKKHLINSSGEEELLDIYTTKVEATQSRLPCKSILVDIDGQMTTCYIGLTDELDTPKCSSKRVQIDDKTYAERKYMGMVNFNNYMRNTYPDTYKTMTELPEQLPDTSDATNMSSFFEGCVELVSTPNLNTSNCQHFFRTYHSCRKLQEVPFLDTHNATSVSNMYAGTDLVINYPNIDTSNVTSFDSMYNMYPGANVNKNFPTINTSKGTNFYEMYAYNKGTVEFPLIDTTNGKVLSGMYYGCSSMITSPNINITNNATTVKSMYGSCIKMEKLTDNIDTSNCTDFSYFLNDCRALKSIPLLDTSNGIDFSYMLTSVNQVDQLQTINTSSGVKFDSMYNCYHQQPLPTLSYPLIDTSHGYSLRDIYAYNKTTTTFPKIDTSMAKDLRDIYRDCSKATTVCDFNLASFSKESVNTMLNKSLQGCSSLNDVVFTNVPLRVTEDELKTACGNQNITPLITYRTVRNNIRPIRTIKAKNGKLVDIDNSGNMPIIRKGNKPLDEYITQSGDWGTIYDDGENFKCLVTKDNFIYCGKKYNSTTRNSDIQPEIPEGIEVPNGIIMISSGSIDRVYDMSMIITNVRTFKEKSQGHILIGRCISKEQINQEKNKLAHWYTDTEIDSDYICRAYSYDLKINNVSNEKTSPQFIGDTKNNFDTIVIGDYNNRAPDILKEFHLYNELLFSEELEEQLNKIKNGTTAHRIIKSKTVDVQGQPRQRLVDIDTDGDSPIRINGVAGTYNLDDYIVYDTEWGTIYSDGAVTVQNLAPNTLQEYTIALEELENIQSNPVSLHSNETYTPFDFNNQQDYSNLINDINNSSLKRMSQEEINQLSTSTIPTPIQFGVTIFKDGTIYLGKAYLNTDMLRGRPEPPEGILVPNSALSISKSFDKEDMSIVFKDLLFTSTPTGAHQPLIYCNTGSSNYWLSFGDENNRTSSCAYSGIYREELKKNSSTFVSGNKNTFYFTVKDFFGSGHNEYFGAKELKLWNRNLTKEELLLEKEPVIAMSVTRDENNPSPELTYTEELL